MLKDNYNYNHTAWENAENIQSRDLDIDSWTETVDKSVDFQQR